MDVFHWIGVLIVAVLLSWLAFKLAKGLWTCGLADAMGFTHKWKVGDDCWAVITGGTDGIGLEYARQFAGKGLNLLLISRSEEKLKRVQSEITASCHKCKEVRYLVVDFTRQDIYERIEVRNLTGDWTTQ